jgi:hypothetical protein
MIILINEHGVEVIKLSEKGKDLILIIFGT